jgi:hypothetical protein
VPEITIHESTGERGELVTTRLSYEEGRLVITVAGEAMPLPDGALDAVMKRYGKPLGIDESEMKIAERLELDDGRALVRFRFMPRYDIIAHDYLVLLVPGEEALCELATGVRAALEHLARRLLR